jgi:hypothetical protein
MEILDGAGDLGIGILDGLGFTINTRIIMNSPTERLESRSRLVMHMIAEIKHIFLSIVTHHLFIDHLLDCSRIFTKGGLILEVCSPSPPYQVTKKLHLLSTVKVINEKSSCLFKSLFWREVALNLRFCSF